MVLGKLPVPGRPTIWITVGAAVGWLLGGCVGFSGLLRQLFSLYRAVSKRARKRRERIDESKNVQTTPTRTYRKRNRPLSYYHPNCRTPRHWKFTQDHRTTRPPPRVGVVWTFLISSILSLLFLPFFGRRPDID